MVDQAFLEIDVFYPRGDQLSYPATRAVEQYNNQFISSIVEAFINDLELVRGDEFGDLHDRYVAV